MPIFIAIEQREQKVFFVYICRWGGGGGGGRVAKMNLIELL